MIKGYEDVKEADYIKTSRKLEWSDTVLTNMKNQPRQPRESPLKEWWKAEQDKKRSQKT